MITERQLAEDALMRLRIAGAKYPPTLDEIEGVEYCETDDIEFAVGSSRIYRKGDFWCASRQDESGCVSTHSFKRGYGKAMSKFVAFVLDEFPHMGAKQ